MPDKIDPCRCGKDNLYMKEYWQKVADIIAGQDTIVEKGSEYLRKLPGENKEDYDFRLNCAKFTNIYRDIVEVLAGKPFEKEVSLPEGEGKSVPDEVKTFSENVDGEGNNLTVFAAELFFNGINDAISWVFIDYPKESPRTRAELKEMNISPFWSIVLAENVLEVKTTKIGAKRIISYARIYEPENEKVREFERGPTGQIEWRVYRKLETGWTAEPEETGFLTIKQIPLIPFITGRRIGKGFCFHAPLKAAVDLQMILYDQESALEYAKRMTAFPMLSASGVSPERDTSGEPKPIRVGPRTVLYAPRNGDGQAGAWTYVEPGAQSLKFLQNDIKETKQDLRELGKQPLTAQAGLTVITTAYAAGKSKTAVNAWGLALKDALENAMVITCEFFGISREQYDPEVYVYDDYDAFGGGDFEAVKGMRDKKDLSRETLWAEAKRRDILSAEFDPKAETTRLLKELPGDENDPFNNPQEEQDDA